MGCGGGGLVEKVCVRVCMKMDGQRGVRSQGALEGQGRTPEEQHRANRSPYPTSLDEQPTRPHPAPEVHSSHDFSLCSCSPHATPLV